MPRVLNLASGREHAVPPGHWSLTSDQYRVVDEPPAAAPAVTTAPKPRSPKAAKK